MFNRIWRKPLTVNQAWKGQRFKSPLYKTFSTAVGLLLKALRPKPPIPPTDKWLFGHYRWGVSNITTDVDNPTKVFQDVLFTYYKEQGDAPKDHKIRFLILEKIKTSKGAEFIDFTIRDDSELITHLENIVREMKIERGDHLNRPNIQLGHYSKHREYKILLHLYEMEQPTICYSELSEELKDLGSALVWGLSDLKNYGLIDGDDEIIRITAKGKEFVRYKQSGEDLV